MLAFLLFLLRFPFSWFCFTGLFFITFLTKQNFCFIDIIFSFLPKDIKIRIVFFFLDLCSSSLIMAVCFDFRDFSQMLGDSWLCTHMFEGNVKLLMGSVSVLGLSLSAGDFIVQTQSLGGAALPPPRPSPLKLLSEPKCQYLSVSFRLVCPGRNFLLLGCQTSCA